MTESHISYYLNFKVTVKKICGPLIYRLRPKDKTKKKLTFPVINLFIYSRYNKFFH